MKIEIGESMMYTWLRHVKGCKLAQMNWKPSPLWEMKNKEAASKFMDDSIEYYRQNGPWEIFKKRGLNQVVQQAEIDVFGQSPERVYAIDIAYHENGLNYGSPTETCARVIKKMIRTALCVSLYFPNQETQCIFASPKINNATLSILRNAMDEANDNCSMQNISYRLICNADFHKEVFLEVEKISSKVADTNELYLRSLQLNQLIQRHDTKNLKFMAQDTEEQ